MKLEDFRIALEIPAPLERVWPELVTWKKQGEWMALTRVEASANGADDSGVGTTIDAFTGIGPIGILDKMRVTKWEPPTFCQVEHFGSLIKGIGEFRLTRSSSNVTRFDWYERIDAPRFILVLVKPGILIAVYISLRKFARSFK
jgi:hypothetical protein